ncbi:MAG TPA: glycosyltransferase family 2 protein [Flavobacterium sp.]|nr:glycosyltransferase family 2 protein [Flavobacterium sp.]
MLAIIPAFNEQNNILQVIREIQAALPDVDILVVNDCSVDNTSMMARMAANVKVVDLPCNLGIGGAMQTGFKYAMVAGYEYVVQIDGDGQHVPAEVSKMMEIMLQGRGDMVIGSRFLDVQSFRTTWCRRAGIKLFYLLFRTLVNSRITDSTSGFRLYNRKSLAVLSRYYSSDYPEPDAIVLLKKHGLQICEVGVEMREREHGNSSITPIKSPYYMTKVILTILFSCARPRR